MLTRSFTFDTDTLLPDQATVFALVSTAGFTVPASNITSIQVKNLNITHPFVADLDIYLVDPDGNETLLISNIGDDGDDFLNTTFSDASNNLIENALAPFSGTFRPMQALNDLIPGQIAGTWKLKIADDTFSDDGMLHGFELVFNYVNNAPSAVSVSATVTSLYEDVSTASRVKVANLVVSDDGVGSQTLALTGPDATSFEIIGTELFLRAGVKLDFETKASFSVVVTANDPTVGGNVDVSSATFTVNVSNKSPENVFGSSGHDTLNGGTDGDRVYGFSGNDRINTYGGDDVITGGRGRDTMSGGSGGDRFDFNAASETGRSSATRDIIGDFRHLVDTIDLKGIDANTKKSSNQSFKYIGVADFHNVAGELRAEISNPAGKANDRIVISGDINGDGNADFQIQLNGITTLSKVDFIL
ncbi:MAG: proprotein convertase P-domain-containing protein [Hyphomicrobium sp.]